MAVGSLGGTRLVVTCLTLLWFGKLTRGADVLRPGIGKDFFGSGHYSVVNVARLHLDKERQVLCSRLLGLRCSATCEHYEPVPPT